MYKNKAAHHIERRAAFLFGTPLRESNPQLTLRRGLLLRSKKVLTAVKICDFGNGERFL